MTSSANRNKRSDLITEVIGMTGPQRRSGYFQLRPMAGIPRVRRAGQRPRLVTGARKLRALSKLAAAFSLGFACTSHGSQLDSLRDQG
jgi:hypothetical protein